MDDWTIYVIMGILMSVIGFLLGFLLVQQYYRNRFLDAARQCEQQDSIVPLISELEKES